MLCQRRQALAQIEKRLRRYKSRLKDRSARKSHAEAVAMVELNAPTLQCPELRDRGARRRDEHDEAGYSPVIIAEATTSLKRLSVSEAVMELI